MPKSSATCQTPLNQRPKRRSISEQIELRPCYLCIRYSRAHLLGSAVFLRKPQKRNTITSVVRLAGCQTRRLATRWIKTILGDNESWPRKPKLAWLLPASFSKQVTMARVSIGEPCGMSRPLHRGINGRCCRHRWLRLRCSTCTDTRLTSYFVEVVCSIAEP